MRREREQDDMMGMSWKWTVAFGIAVVGMIGALLVGGLTDVDSSVAVGTMAGVLTGLVGPTRKRVAEDTSKTRRGER